jgi:hypothetical protein
MEHRVVWVHGIGQHSPGYSAPWERVFNQYLNFSHEDYLEVCWDTVFTAALRALAGSGNAIGLTRAEQLAEADVRADLETILLARQSVLLRAAPAPGLRAVDDEVVEWARFKRRLAAARRAPPGGGEGALPDWLAHPDAYLGDFAKYLVSRRLRGAVKEKVKERLRPLVGGGYRIAIIAHSWGTVVAYDSLLDLAAEVPDLRIAHLITLGSPLWLVRRLLEERSGRKPEEVANWINIHARGDLVGSWLQPGFAVDRDFEVPSVGDGDAHGSYFAPGNSAVQHDIIAAALLA